MNKIIASILLLSAIIVAQDTTEVDSTWQKEAIGSLSFSQAHFDNWAYGGENTIAYQFDLSVKLINNNDKYIWAHTGKIALGNSKIGDYDAKKTIDEIRLESLLTYLWKFQPDPYVSFKGETQIAPGYVYDDSDKKQVSAFLDPAYFTLSTGFIYNPMGDLSVRFGAAVKETITKDYPVPFADESGTVEIEKTKVESGVESVIAFSKKIGEGTLIKSTLDVFNNFNGFNATDVKWDTDIITQITKHINFKFKLKLFYDEDISTQRQLNQSLLLGISYTIL